MEIYSSNSTVNPIKWRGFPGRVLLNRRWRKSAKIQLNHAEVTCNLIRFIWFTEKFRSVSRRLTYGGGGRPTVAVFCLSREKLSAVEPISVLWQRSACGKSLYFQLFSSCPIHQLVAMVCRTTCGVGFFSPNLMPLVELGNSTPVPSLNQNRRGAQGGRGAPTRRLLIETWHFRCG